MGEDAIIVAIVFGSILGMIVIPMLFSLVKKWIDRNNSSYDEEAFDRLAKAFIQHKKETKRRLQNLEAIIAENEDKTSSAASSKKQLEEPKSHEKIEIDSDSDDSKSRQENRESSRGGNLKNMLDKKREK